MVRSKQSRQGYLELDLRHAPGPSLEQIAASGKTNVIGAGAHGLFETATVTCSHCHRVLDFMGDRSRVGYCRVCDSYTCDRAGCCRGCLPMNQQLDVALNQAHHDPSLVEAAVLALRRSVLG